MSAVSNLHKTDSALALQKAQAAQQQSKVQAQAPNTPQATAPNAPAPAHLGKNVNTTA
jgi:hypothetical protein